MPSSAYRASQSFCIFQIFLQAEVQRALALRSQFVSLILQLLSSENVHITIFKLQKASYYNFQASNDFILQFLSSESVPITVFKLLQKASYYNF